MRHFVRTAAVCGIVAMLCASAQAQELLSNPDLDLTSISTQVLPTPTGWNVEAERTISGPFNDGASSEGFCNVQQPGGFGLFFKPFQGNPATVGTLKVSFSQAVAATPGLPYALSAWAGAGPGYIGLTDPTVTSTLYLDFLNAGSGLISSVALDLKAAGLGVPNGNPFGYRQFFVNGISPAGTAFAQARMVMDGAYANPAGGDQAFVADAFSMRIPEPTSLGMLSIAGLAMLARRRNA